MVETRRSSSSSKRAPPSSQASPPPSNKRSKVLSFLIYCYYSFFLINLGFKSWVVWFLCVCVFLSGLNRDETLGYWRASVDRRHACSAAVWGGFEVGVWISRAGAPIFRSGPHRWCQACWRRQICRCWRGSWCLGVSSDSWCDLVLFSLRFVLIHNFVLFFHDWVFGGFMNTNLVWFVTFGWGFRWNCRRCREIKGGWCGF